MDSLFLTVLNMSLTGALVILAICLLRLPLKKVPKIISYCLWAVAGFRLLVPFTIESALSLIPSGVANMLQGFTANNFTATVRMLHTSPQTKESIFTQGARQTEIFETTVSAFAHGAWQPENPHTHENILTQGAWQTETPFTVPTVEALETAASWSLVDAAAFIWLLGFCAMIVYGFASYIRVTPPSVRQVHFQTLKYTNLRLYSRRLCSDFSNRQFFCQQGLARPPWSMCCFTR